MRTRIEKTAKARRLFWDCNTFRRTLASVLVKMKVDGKTVQEILRHQYLISSVVAKRPLCCHDQEFAKTNAL
jgi:hypothetical protein